MLYCDDNRLIVVIELVGSDVNYDLPLFKPSMRTTLTIAKNIIKATASVLFEIFRKKMTGLPTTTTRKILKGESWGSYRLTLLNGKSELGCENFQFVYITIDHSTGRMFVNKGYPISVQNLMKNNQELSEQLNRYATSA